MTLGYGEEKNGRISTAGVEDFDALLMSRLDFEMHVLDIPPIADREIEGLIRFRLRSIYPGSPRETAFDYRLIRRGSARRAVLFISRSKTVDAYREAAGRRPLLLPCLLLLRHVPTAGNFRAWVWHGAWAELLLFRGGVLISSSVHRSARGRQFMIEKGEEGLPREERNGSVMVTAAAADFQRMGPADGISRVPLEALARKLRKTDGLFSMRKKDTALSPWLRLAGCAAAVILLAVLVFIKDLRAIEARVVRLRTIAGAMENDARRVREMQAEVESLAAERDRREAKRPGDPYLLLSELSRALGSGVLLRSMSFRDESFQGEAIGLNPLALMEAFQARLSFSAVKLSPIVPDGKTGRERFSFSGVFHGR
jgi:hypothetical protein